MIKFIVGLIIGFLIGVVSGWMGFGQGWLWQ